MMGDGSFQAQQCRKLKDLVRENRLVVARNSEGALGRQKGGTRRTCVLSLLFSKDCILKDGGGLNVGVNYLASKPRTGW